MIEYIKKIRYGEKGSVTVIAAVSMTALLLFTALGIDFGFTYYKTSDAQNAADSAALAAGSLLPVYSGDAAAVQAVKEKAAEYAQKNGGYSINEDDVTLGAFENGYYTSVDVSIPCVIPLNFAKLIGIASYTTARSASCAVAPCMSTSGLNPLGVDYQQLQTLIASGETEHIYLKYGGGDGDNGSYGAIDLDGVKGGGASDFNAWLNYGYNGTIEVGDNLLPVEKGNMAGPTYSAIVQRYNECTHFSDQGGCTAEHFDPDCPRVLKVLVIEKVGNSYVRVKGFAAFIIEGVYGDEVVGSYIKYYDEGSIDKDADWSVNDYGMYNICLTS